MTSKILAHNTIIPNSDWDWNSCPQCGAEHSLVTNEWDYDTATARFEMNCSSCYITIAFNFDTAPTITVEEPTTEEALMEAWMP